MKYKIEIENDYNKNEKIYNNIVTDLTVYVILNDIKSLVLGVSGGIDSALIAAIAADVRKNLVNNNYDRELKIIGYYLPILSNKNDEETRSFDIGNNFISSSVGDSKFRVSMAPHDNYNNFCGKSNIFNGMSDQEEKRAKIANGNIKARLRMIYLYNKAFLNNGMVLSTDNLTEYFLGFWTLHGDVGDYGAIQNLWKTEVYNLSKYLVNKYILTKETNKANALNSCINATPTDGLGITDSDFDQLGINNYYDIDKILIKYLNSDFDNPYEKVAFQKQYDSIVGRMKRTKYKRENPISISRDVIFKNLN